MDETQCKIGDEYYTLKFNSTNDKAGTKYEGILLFDVPLEFQYSVEKDNEISNFKPPDINPDIITAIKDAIDDFTLIK